MQIYSHGLAVLPVIKLVLGTLLSCLGEDRSAPCSLVERLAAAGADSPRCSHARGLDAVSIAIGNAAMI